MQLLNNSLKNHIFSCPIFSMANFNISSIKTTDDGLWQGDDPLHYAFPLLIVQTILVILTSRVVAFVLTPLRQPIVVAEIVGGIVLGPSVLGRNKYFMALIFPPWSTPVLESVASIGLLFFLFLIGLEFDLVSIRRCWKRASCIAIAGISLPFLLGIGVTFLSKKVLNQPAGHPKFGPRVMFIGVSLSITAFPVLARILAELQLLTTGVGETAMAAAAINDIVAWALLALAVAVAGGGDGAAATPVWILLSALGFIAFMLAVIRPAVALLIRRFEPGGAAGRAHVVATLAGVMLAGFATDLIGIHAIFGAFVLGVIVPKSGEFPAKLTVRIDDFVSGLLLPLYFASTGLKTDISKIHGGAEWGLLVVVIAAACAGKFLATFAVALACTIPVRESLALGVLMNTKGLVELIVLNIGREKKVLDDKMFAILVMMALFTTFLTTPLLMAIYRPGRHRSTDTQPESRGRDGDGNDNDHRILACIRGPAELPSLTALINSQCRSTEPAAAKVYMMRLLEMTHRFSSIATAQRTRRNGLPCIARFCHGDFDRQVAAAFEGSVRLRLATSVSTLPMMDKDICHVAGKKRAAIIILPFHLQWKTGEAEDVETDLGQGWRGVNERVLANAPCSVALLVDRGFGPGPGCNGGERVRRVCIAFLGGPDSREALGLGGRMAGHPGTRVTVVMFCGRARPDGENRANPSSWQVVEIEDQERDEASIAEFRRKWGGTARFVEKGGTNVGKEVLGVAESREFELIVVGKGRFRRALAVELGNQQVEYEELGQVGGMLASCRYHIGTSVLVVQQHNSTHEGHSLT